MLMFDGVFGLALLGLWIFSIIDVITTPEDRCRNLPKVVWVLIVLLLTFIGSIAWLFAGRPWDPKPTDGSGRASMTRRPPARRPVATNPDDDEEFLAGLRARAEEQRRRARQAEPREDEPPAGPVS